MTELLARRERKKSCLEKFKQICELYTKYRYTHVYNNNASNNRKNTNHHTSQWQTEHTYIALNETKMWEFAYSISHIRIKSTHTVYTRMYNIDIVR